MKLTCRHCKSNLDKEIIDLGNQPLSNSLLSKETFEDEITYPLKVYLCTNCWLMQLPVHKSEKEIFCEEYPYFSSISKSWCLHAKKYVDNVIKKLNLSSDSLVVEIASNDGYLLQYFNERNIPNFGIEPTKETALAAEKKGVSTLRKFFSQSYAKELVDKEGYAEGGVDLLVANNVAAHVPDINDFISGISIMLNKNGVASLEFPHLLKLIEGNQFDTIYHEHFSYFSLNTFIKIVEYSGLNLFDVEELSTHGGSLRVWLTNNLKIKKSINVFDLLKKEINSGLENLGTYMNFEGRAIEVKNQLIDFLLKEKKMNKKIYAYGAAAKGNTLLNFAGINNDQISAVADLAPSKQGKFLPGSRIPIISPEKLKSENPDSILILPWNLISELKNELSYSKLFTAIPKLTFLN